MKMVDDVEQRTHECVDFHHKPDRDEISWIQCTKRDICCVTNKYRVHEQIHMKGEIGFLCSIREREKVNIKC